MNGKKSFVLYHDMRQPLAILSDAQRGKLLLALFDYAEQGALPSFDDDGALSMAFSFIRQTLDRDAASWEETRRVRAEAGRKGAESTNGKRRQMSANVGYAEQDTAKSAGSVSVPVSENGIETVSESVSATSETHARSTFEPPSVKDVEQYASTEGLSLDASRFCDYYASKGWVIGNSPMQDWQAAVRNWARREQQQTAEDTATAPRNDLPRAMELLKQMREGGKNG